MQCHCDVCVMFTAEVKNKFTREQAVESCWNDLKTISRHQKATLAKKIKDKMDKKKEEVEVKAKKARALKKGKCMCFIPARVLPAHAYVACRMLYIM